jgi:hypothetical protein
VIPIGPISGEGPLWPRPLLKRYNSVWWGRLARPVKWLGCASPDQTSGWYLRYMPAVFPRALYESERLDVDLHRQELERARRSFPSSFFFLASLIPLFASGGLSRKRPSDPEGRDCRDRRRRFRWGPWMVEAVAFTAAAHRQRMFGRRILECQGNFGPDLWHGLDSTLGKPTLGRSIHLRQFTRASTTPLFSRPLQTWFLRSWDVRYLELTMGTDAETLVSLCPGWFGLLPYRSGLSRAMRISRWHCNLAHLSLFGTYLCHAIPCTSLEGPLAD